MPSFEVTVTAKRRILASAADRPNTPSTFALAGELIVDTTKMEGV